jgi:hypothetical protein
MADGWASCLMLVAAYDDVRPAVEEAVERTRRAIMLSPVLVDFVALELVELGARAGGDETPAAARLLAAITAPRVTAAPTNYSAVTVIDDDAVDAAELLDAFADACALAGFDAARAGIATRDGREAPGADPIDVVGDAAPLRDALAGALWSVCEATMGLASNGGLDGLPPTAFVPAPDPEPEVGEPSSLAELSATETVEPAAVVSAPPAPPVRRRPLAARRSQRRPAPPPARVAADTSGAIPALVLVALVGGTESATPAAVRRAREVLLELTDGFADLPRVIDGIAHTLLVLDPAGGVVTLPEGRRVRRRRAIPRPSHHADLPKQLEAVGGAVKREMNMVIHRAGHVARPTLVLVAVEAPMADAGSVGLMAELTARVDVIWVLIDEAATLLSDRLQGSAAAVADHTAVAAELVTRITGTPSPAPPAPAVAGESAGDDR